MRTGGRAGLGLGMALVANATPASAAEPYYFHKAAVTREAYTADVSECGELAGGVRVAPTYTYSPNLYAAAANALFSGIMQGAERRRLQDKVQRTCMADKGYRRMTIDKSTVRALKTLQDKERLDRLFGLAAAAAPVGAELPE